VSGGSADVGDEQKRASSIIPGHEVGTRVLNLRQARATCGGEAGACNVWWRGRRVQRGGEAGACNVWWRGRRVPLVVGPETN
jgi:hypothetical protein